MYSKPKGKELSALKRIRKLVNDIDAAKSSLSMVADEILEDNSYDGEFSVRISSWGITSAHALDGVRTNGDGRLTSIANFVRGVRSIRERRAGTQRKLDKVLRTADRLLAQLERIVGPFELCKVCKGRKGRHIPRDEGQSITKRWQDCYACDGRGIRLA
mgnify:CR=1 FL=1